MVLLASEFDQSRFFKAEGYGEQDKKFRIKDVTSEVLEDDDGKTEKKLVVWFTNSDRVWSSTRRTCRTLQGRFRRRHSPTGSARSSSCIRRWPTSAARWSRRCGCGSRRRSRHAAAPQQPVTSGNGANAPAAGRKWCGSSCCSASCGSSAACRSGAGCCGSGARA